MSELALLGGDKAVTLKAGSKELASDELNEIVLNQIKKGEITGKAKVLDEFEERFSDYTGAEFALTSCNGTTSIQQGLFGVGVSPGDEVLVTSYTFWASVGPIITNHGIPVFCDVDPDSYCISPDDIEKKITSKTKAILAVHVWGAPCNMDALLEIADEHDLGVVEDCSHAHGAEWNGQKLGTIGDVGCFSLQGTKLLKAGEGGVLVTDDRECLERAAVLGNNRKKYLADDSPYRKYSTGGFGFTHRAHPLGIAIANHQLKELDEMNEIRDTAGRYLEEGIDNIDAVSPQKVYEKGRRVYAYHYMKYDPEKMEGVSLSTFLKALRAEGVSCGGNWYGKLHKEDLFLEKTPYGKGCPGKCEHVKIDRTNEAPELPATEYLHDHTFRAAPRFEQPCEELLEQYIEAYQKVYANVDQLKSYQEGQD